MKKINIGKIFISHGLVRKNNGLEQLEKTHPDLAQRAKESMDREIKMLREIVDEVTKGYIKAIREASEVFEGEEVPEDLKTLENAILKAKEMIDYE